MRGDNQMNYKVIYHGCLMLGVDIYKLTAMHYVEGITPGEINERFEPTEAINRKYPPDEWFMEAGHPPVKAWYKIQDMAYEFTADKGRDF